MRYHNTLDSLCYYQRAAECAALYRQGFALAELRLLEGLHRRQQAGLDPSTFYVVSDCDETILDNSAYNTWLLETGRDFHDSTWSEWCRRGEARATPGAVEFAKFVVEHGASLVYVTSRFESERAETAKNLEALGFPLPDGSSNPEKTFLFLQNMLLGGKPSRKREQLEVLRQRFGAAPILQLGDSLSDHDPSRYSSSVPHEERMQRAEEDALRWGGEWIVFPNPVYGSWRQSLGVSDEEPPAPFQEAPVRPPVFAKEAPKVRLLRRPGEGNPLPLR